MLRRVRVLEARTCRRVITLAVTAGAVECDRYCMVAMAAVITDAADPLRLIRPLADTSTASRRLHTYLRA